MSFLGYEKRAATIIWVAALFYTGLLLVINGIASFILRQARLHPAQI